MRPLPPRYRTLWKQNSASRRVVDVREGSQFIFGIDCHEGTGEERVDILFTKEVQCGDCVLVEVGDVQVEVTTDSRRRTDQLRVKRNYNRQLQFANGAADRGFGIIRRR